MTAEPCKELTNEGKDHRRLLSVPGGGGRGAWPCDAPPPSSLRPCAMQNIRVPLPTTSLLVLGRHPSPLTTEPAAPRLPSSVDDAPAEVVVQQPRLKPAPTSCLEKPLHRSPPTLSSGTMDCSRRTHLVQSASGGGGGRRHETEAALSTEQTRQPPRRP